MPRHVIHPRPAVLHCGRCGLPMPPGRAHDCPGAPPPREDVTPRRQCPRCRGYYSGDECVCVQVRRVSDPNHGESHE